jgi:hypothetical protein
MITAKHTAGSISGEIKNLDVTPGHHTHQGRNPVSFIARAGHRLLSRMLATM